MILEIDYHSGIPIYRQIVQQVRRQIMIGNLKEGGQLESVRELAARLKVNPMTVSKAYSLLETENLLERRCGIGLFVNKVSKKLRDEIREEIIESILNKAAVTAIQFEINEAEAIAFFKKCYRQYHSKGRR